MSRSVAVILGTVTMTQKSIKKNYILNLAYQILQLLMPLITAPYLSRILGAGGIGAVSYTESIVSYFLLFANMGILTHGQREVSYVRDDLKKRSQVFWENKLLSLCTSVTTLAVYLIFAMFQENRVIYLILSLHLISAAVDVTWFFQGMEEFEKTVLRNGIFKLLNVGYVFLVIRSSEDLFLYVLGYALFNFLGNLTLWGYLPKYIIRVPLRELHPFRDLPVMLSLFLPTIAIQIYTVLDKTMIGVITRDAVENGYYEQSLKISKLALTVVQSAATVMIPRIGYYFEKRETLEVVRLMRQSFRFIWLLGLPLCVGLIIVAENFVPWFFGLGYEKVADLLKILAFLIPVIGISTIVGLQYLVPTKRQNLMTRTVALGACVNFILNIFLIRTWQSTGAAVASVTAECVVTISQLYMVRKDLPLLPIFLDSRNYVISVGVMAGWLSMVSRFMEPAIVSTAFMVGSGAAVYFAVLLLLRDDFLVSAMKTVWEKFVPRKP